MEGGEIGIENNHRIFSVLIDNKASATAIIQNRTITFGSGHPFSSKWWCSGAIRKIRRPLVILKNPT